jgi:hypothetical protein
LINALKNGQDLFTKDGKAEGYDASFLHCEREFEVHPVIGTFSITINKID